VQACDRALFRNSDFDGAAFVVRGKDLFGEHEALNDRSLVRLRLGTSEHSIIIIVAFGIEDHLPFSAGLLLEGVVLDNPKAYRHPCSLPYSILTPILYPVFKHLGVHLHYLFR
jgi:hypothetical protein